MKKYEILSLLAALCLLALGACSKDEPVLPAENEAYADRVGLWENMIASADGHEVVYSSLQCPTECSVDISAEGETLNFVLSPEARHSEFLSSEYSPVTSHLFRLGGCMEIDGVNREDLSEFIDNRYLESETAWFDAAIAWNETGSMVQTSWATFSANDENSSFTVKVEPNNSAVDRVIIYKFAVGFMERPFMLGVHQAANCSSGC